MDSIVNIFKEKNLKLTHQRIAVYDYLSSTVEHPSAETIYKAIHPMYPTISLATIYKTLKTLVDVNLIQELNVGEGNFRYDANADAHPHIQCIHCGKVDDIHDVSFNSLQDEVKKYTPYKVSHSKVYFYGVCPECENKSNLN